MQRILRNQSATITHTFYTDGAATNPDPDSAVVTITRDDGTVLETDDPTVDEGTGIVSYTLTPADTVYLDVLRFDWEATFGGEVQVYTDYIEVVGGFLFTIAQARALSPLSNASAYPTQAIVDARTMVETALEDACGVPFVPRYRRELVSGNGITTMLLHPRVTAVRAVELDGTAVTDADTVLVQPTGLIYYPTGWTAGSFNYSVAYEHGHPYPPPRVSQAALLWAKSHLVKGPIDDRTTSFTTDDGTFALATPGLRGSWTGIPEVDAVIQQYNLNVGVA